MVDGLPDRHRFTANRIPPELRKRLSTAEILARCEEHDRLLKMAGTFPDASVARSYMHLADQMMRALPQSELQEQVDALQKSASSMSNATSRTAFFQRIHQLESENPQPPAETLTAAKKALTATVTARAAAVRSWTREAPKITRAASTSAPDNMLYKGDR